jgi:hypothetical protein
VTRQLRQIESFHQGRRILAQVKHIHIARLVSGDQQSIPSHNRIGKPSIDKLFQIKAVWIIDEDSRPARTRNCPH